MRTLYVEADTILHRLPPRAKLLALAAASIALFLTRSLPWLGIAVLIGVGLYFSLGLPMREALARLRPIFLTIVVVCLFNLLFNSPADAAVVLLRLTTLMLLAATVTATTSIADFIDEITVLVGPLERIGFLKAADVGLAVGLVIRFVPEILARYAAIREAHTARGLPVRPLTLIAPLIILTLRDADSIAAAIDARGFRRQ
ncbi:energy-coupling factor transporter transmembrane protein EcfT [Rhizobiaceae bacterium n13]|uniref:Energy-coupling factor transporter transmembrane protein EcfT n=1 Tax=Ferirhizobium litorale TaxID=2927786 RepID=A0AAE3U014_9HYPH|nr:energy-coupling factor transporter transmembrane protein EcfT [Fererhizobium litorale]MDI7861447.1 energy-coupling factor transporter transmembrane protein EcfT [Fererhizobium litorale]MDI7921594.1 energy-coupling factor transporter transmembrane protein EcfT [Fererhizobium litorale]